MRPQSPTVAIRACARDSASNDERLLLAYTLWRYMVESGRIPEGLAWLTLGLSPGYTEGTLLEARALHAAGFFMGLRGDFDGARAKIDRAVQLCRELDEPSALAWMLIRNGLVLSVQGASDDATSPFREGLDLMKSEGDTVGQAWGHLKLGRVYFLLDELGPALAEFDLAAKDRTAHDPTTVSYGRVDAEACRIVSGSGSSSVLSDAVDELLRMQMMSTSTQGLLLACAAAVSGASYTDAARYSHSLSSAPTATAA